MQQFFLQLLQAVGIQLLGLFGIFFVFAFLLSKLQRWTQNNYSRSVGWKGILWTAWFGTPFHEYGHAVFAKIFRHKIQEIALFQPNAETGDLGYVNHSWNQKSYYQSVGNFFIGMAPMIFGSLVLVGMLYVLVPNGKEVISSLNSTQTILEFFTGIKSALLNLFAIDNLKNIWFWLFLYVSFCIASHIAPSKPDRKGMWQGFILIVISLIFINILTLLLKLDITKYVLSLAGIFSVFIGIFTYATIISFIHFLFTYLILYPLRKY